MSVTGKATHNTINIGTGSQVSVGDGNQLTQNNHYGADAPDEFEQLVREVLEAIPEQDRDRVAKEVFEPLRDILSEEPPETELAQETLRCRIFRYAMMLQPYAGDIVSVVTTFAKGASKAAGPVGWVISGILAVVKGESE